VHACNHYAGTCTKLTQKHMCKHWAYSFKSAANKLVSFGLDQFLLGEDFKFAGYHWV
jgi:hypothetical protein